VGEDSFSHDLELFRPCSQKCFDVSIAFGCHHRVNCFTFETCRISPIPLQTFRPFTSSIHCPGDRSSRIALKPMPIMSCQYLWSESAKWKRRSRKRLKHNLLH
jgi:hypothetical protein